MFCPSRHHLQETAFIKIISIEKNSTMLYKTTKMRNNVLTHLFIGTLMLMSALSLSAQNTDTTAQNKVANKSNSRTGWTLGVLPSVAFDADLGLQYGALTNIYYFGSGDIYPEYYHSFYVEAAYTTMKYGIFRFSYDSKYLIPNHRLSVDVTYLPDAMCDFYGFNGYESRYNSTWTDDENAGYVSRAFYKMQRNLFRASADLQGSIGGKWYWNGGAGLLSYKTGSVDLDKLNRNKDADEALPDTATLYDRYVQWGLIKDNEKAGGTHPYIHGGVTYDSRDRQQNPQHGIHADAFLSYTAAFGDQSEYNNLKINATWRHYIPLWVKHTTLPDGRQEEKNIITLAYRLGMQELLAGESPYYLNTYLNQLYLQRVLYEGLGGANSLRGIMRNRILGDGFLFGNAELRIQLFSFHVKKENFYVGINPFIDWGLLTQRREAYKTDASHGSLDAETLANIIASGANPDDYFYIQQNNASGAKRWNSSHWGAGCGLKIAMNDNFVLSVDWARALNEQDNSKLSNLYIKMGYMF